MREQIAGDAAPGHRNVEPPQSFAALRQICGDGPVLQKLRAITRNSATLDEAYARMLEHLKANQVDLGKTPLILGAPLTLDPKAERFVGEGSQATNPMLTRAYRAPYTVPQLA